MNDLMLTIENVSLKNQKFWKRDSVEKLAQLVFNQSFIKLNYEDRHNKLGEFNLQELTGAEKLDETEFFNYYNLFTKLISKLITLPENLEIDTKTTLLIENYKKTNN